VGKTPTFQRNLLSPSSDMKICCFQKRHHHEPIPRLYLTVSFLPSQMQLSGIYIFFFQAFSTFSSLCLKFKRLLAVIHIFVRSTITRFLALFNFRIPPTGLIFRTINCSFMSVFYVSSTTIPNKSHKNPISAAFSLSASCSFRTETTLKQFEAKFAALSRIIPCVSDNIFNSVV
jgi:hypothetical protein